MLYWAYIMFSVALAAGLVGFGGGQNAVTAMAQGLFFTFIVFALALVALKLFRDERNEAERKPMKEYGR